MRTVKRIFLILMEPVSCSCTMFLTPNTFYTMTYNEKREHKRVHRISSTKKSEQTDNKSSQQSHLPDPN